MCVGLSNLILALFVLMCQHTHVDFVNCILISQTQQFDVMSVIIGITKTCISMSSAEFAGIHDVSWKCIKCTTLKSSSFLYQRYNITISNSYEPLAGIQSVDSVLDQSLKTPTPAQQLTGWVCVTPDVVHNHQQRYRYISRPNWQQ